MESRDDRLPTFSLVIETENLVAGGVTDLERCLDSLAAQTVPMERAGAVFVVDGGRMPDDVIAAVKDRYPWVQFHIVDHPVSYYEAKMIGASLVTTEIVVFADSDVDYAPDWLEITLRTFTDVPDTDVVAGDTVLDLNTPFGVALATTWMLPVLPSIEKPGPSNGFRANNFALRPEILATHPFPDPLPLYRAGVALQRGSLKRDRLKVVRQPRARGVHAPPDTTWEWFWRLMAVGHDAVALRSYGVTEQGVSYDPRAVLRWYSFARCCVSVPLGFVRRSLRLWRQSPETRRHFVLALPIAMASMSLRLLGGLVTCLHRDWVLERILAFEGRAGVDWSKATARRSPQTGLLDAPPALRRLSADGAPRHP